MHTSGPQVSPAGAPRRRAIAQSAALNALGLAAALLCWHALRSVTDSDIGPHRRGALPEAAGPVASEQGNTATRPPAADRSSAAEEVSPTGESARQGTTIAPGGGPAGPADQALRAAVLGDWEDDYRGKRRLTMRADGTATMIVEPEGVGKKLFAARLTFEITWSLENGYLTLRTTSGEPAAKVRLIRKLYGDEAVHAIVELDEQRMVLMDSDGKTQYDWRRPAASTVTAGHSNSKPD